MSLWNPRSSLPAVSLAAGGGQRRHRPDYWLVIFAALLLAIGLVVIYSISPGLSASQNLSQGYFITKELIAVLLGGLTFVIASQIRVSSWSKALPALIIAATACAAIAELTPLNAAYPAHRWLRLGSFSFQVAELIKFALIIWAASFLTKRWGQGKLRDWRQTIRPLLLVLLGVGLVVAKLQSDLGSAAVMVAIVGAIVYMVGLPLRKVALIGLVVVVAAGLAISTSAYRRERLSSFWHPENHCQTSAYQACQAIIAVGSGGVAGLGLGNSVQAYGYLPEASNDSIFAILAEKFGFIGTTMVVVLYGLLITRLKTIIERTRDQFSRLVVVGILAWISSQMIINVGAMLGLLPLKGITLPLISQGGTSVLFLTAALGLVFQVSRYTSYSADEPRLNHHENLPDSLNGRGVRRPYNPAYTARPRT